MGDPRYRIIIRYRKGSYIAFCNVGAYVIQALLSDRKYITSDLDYDLSPPDQDVRLINL